MALARTVSLALLALLMPFGGLCCGMDMVTSGAPPARDSATAPDAASAARAASSDAASEIVLDTIEAGAADAGHLSEASVCKLNGSVCATSADCCSGLSCQDVDDKMTCTP